jgi:aryl-alcohol dehydrogenase-like predicted oxidoreductase
MQTDYLDLYQLHYQSVKPTLLDSVLLPYRTTNGRIIFMKYPLWMVLSRKGKSSTSDYLMKMLGELCDFLEENHYNLTCKTIQNPYSLLNRLFENASSEICYREM